MDTEKVKREEKVYKKIPVITDFTDENGNDRMKETVQANQGVGSRLSPTSWNALPTTKI